MGISRQSTSKRSLKSVNFDKKDFQGRHISFPRAYHTAVCNAPQIAAKVAKNLWVKEFWSQGIFSPRNFWARNIQSVTV